MGRSRTQAGFTLVEMMVTLGIISILGMLAIPSFNAVVPRIKLNNATMVMANEIALARVRAISKSTDFRITFHASPENAYTIEKFEGSWVSLGRTSIAGTQLASVAGFTPSATTMIAYANGQINVPLGGPAAAIELTTDSGDVRKRVLVEASGRTSVERWGGAGGWVQD